MDLQRDGHVVLGKSPSFHSKTQALQLVCTYGQGTIEFSHYPHTYTNAHMHANTYTQCRHWPANRTLRVAAEDEPNAYLPIKITQHILLVEYKPK